MSVAGSRRPVAVAGGQMLTGRTSVEARLSFYHFSSLFSL